jgi:hypothetical protein
MIASAPGSAGHRLAAVVAIRDRDRFKEAVRTKLVLEIAGSTPERAGSSR